MTTSSNLKIVPERAKPAPLQIVPKVSDAEVRAILIENEKSTLLRFSTAGSVDDGKSTLIGRLLHDSKNVYEDHIAALEKKAVSKGIEIDLSHLTDGLKAEQEQGITIDVAYRYFSTPHRRFILADTPGHEQYTRNMATGASTADLTIILIDARKGVVTQTKRHSFIASLLGVPRLLVAVNKMDLVSYEEEVYEKIRQEYTVFASKLGIREIRFIPVSALKGDNIVARSDTMSWYHGETIMEYLENVYVASDSNQVDFRFPVQYVVRPDQNYRGYAGQIKSGSVRVGEEVLVIPSMKKSIVKSIDYLSSDPSKCQLESASAPQSVTISLEDEIDISRGDMLVRPNNMPKVKQEFEAMIVWMNEEPMSLSKSYIVMHTSRETRGYIGDIKYRVDVNSLSREPGEPLKLNEIGRVSITTKAPLFIDSYNKNRFTGNFVLVDPENFLTIAAGMIIDRMPEDVEAGSKSKDIHSKNVRSQNVRSQDIRSQDIHREEGKINRALREKSFGHKAMTIWCTGLSGSGKSTIAKGIESRFFESQRPVYRLDGDNLRFGLNKDLGFSKENRTENIRRAAEVAKLFNDAGLSVICSLISPMREDRERAKEIVGAEHFFELYLSAPLSECEKRDPHGLYKKARAGEIKEFTGITAPYEPPLDAELTLDTAALSPDECIRLILEKLKTRHIKA